jgi:hypothetical protein
MTDDPKSGVERRKNPSRKKIAAIGISYTIEWNEARRTFDIYRDGAKTGGFARDKATAIGMATGDAQREPQGVKVAVFSIRDGKAVVEWSN